MILEPLQAMIQLGLLAFSPLGTKLAIHQNVLHLQHPTLIQGFARWYAGDKKDDLYYLFHVFRRFILWYGRDATQNTSMNTHTFEKARIDHQLYKILLRNAHSGLEMLMQTYQQSEMGSLVHVLKMYKLFLEEPKYFLRTHDPVPSTISNMSNMSRLSMGGGHSIRHRTYSHPSHRDHRDHHDHREKEESREKESVSGASGTSRESTHDTHDTRTVRSDTGPTLSPYHTPTQSPALHPVHPHPTDHADHADHADREHDLFAPSLETMGHGTVDQSINIDMIFRQTKSMYSHHLKTILVHTFSMLETAKETDRAHLIHGLTKLLEPCTRNLQGWIQKHLVL